MKGERLNNQAVVTVFNSEGTVIEYQKTAIIGGRIRPTIPAGKVVVSYSIDSVSVRPNRAERRRMKRKG